MLSLDHERRAEPRISLTRACKIFDPRTRRYVPGTTCNVSCDGLLLRLHQATNLTVGDRIYVGIAERRRHAILRSNEMLEATVLRVMHPGMGETVVAIRWLDADPMMALPLREAA